MTDYDGVFSFFWIDLPGFAGGCSNRFRGLHEVLSHFDVICLGLSRSKSIQVDLGRSRSWGFLFFGGYVLGFAGGCSLVCCGAVGRC